MREGELVREVAAATAGNEADDRRSVYSGWCGRISEYIGGRRGGAGVVEIDKNALLNIRMSVVLECDEAICMQ